jgi:hypothetical protein
MSKRHPDGVPFPVVATNATTAGPDMIRAISDSTHLRDITRYCVFLEQDGDVAMLVYRDSSTAPGLLSGDVYARREGDWVRTGEDPEKFKHLLVPPATERTEIGGIPFWSHQPIDAERRRWFEDLQAEAALQPAKR